MGFIDDLAARLKQPLPGAEAQLKMSPRHPRARPLTKDAPADVRHAAALILLFPNDAGTKVPAYDPKVPAYDPTVSADKGFSFVLTLRRDDLLHHPGQISLPGGGIDEDEMPEAASLREAEEEIGVDPSTVRILGALTPLYVMVSGFVVTPFVGVVDARPDFRPHAREVAAILEVPVSQLTDPARRMWGNRTREGYLIEFPYFDVEDVAHRSLGEGGSSHQVWGATAMMLSEFVELL